MAVTDPCQPDPDPSFCRAMFARFQSIEAAHAQTQKLMAETQQMLTTHVVQNENAFAELRALFAQDDETRKRLLAFMETTMAAQTERQSLVLTAKKALVVLAITTSFAWAATVLFKGAVLEVTKTQQEAHNQR